MDISSFKIPTTPVTPRTPALLEIRKPTPLKPSAMLAFRMKRSSGGVLGSARRVLGALGKNNSQYNLRLAETLLDVPREKFTQNWNFDPVKEMPTPPGQFQWTPTTLVSPFRNTPTYKSFETPTTAAELRLQPSSPSNAGEDPQTTPSQGESAAGKKPDNINREGGQHETTASTPAVMTTTSVYCLGNKENSFLRQPNLMRRLSLGLKPVPNKNNRKLASAARRQSLPTSQPIITDFLRPRKRQISAIKDTLLLTSPKKRMLAF